MIESQSEIHDYNLERLIMLSDGVFAIAMTLLALELRPPEGWDGGVMTLLHGMTWPLFAFVISFLSIGILWSSHRQTFGRLYRSDGGLVLCNILLLACITLIPVVTRIVTLGHFRGALVWIYIGLFQLIGLINFVLWIHAAFVGRLARPGMSLPFRIAIAAIVLIVPPLQTALGVLGSQPRLGWTPLLIPLVMFATGAGRRLAMRLGGDTPLMH